MIKANNAGGNRKAGAGPGVNERIVVVLGFVCLGNGKHTEGLFHNAEVNNGAYACVVEECSAVGKAFFNENAGPLNHAEVIVCGNLLFLVLNELLKLFHKLCAAFVVNGNSGIAVCIGLCNLFAGCIEDAPHIVELTAPAESILIIDSAAVVVVAAEGGYRFEYGIYSPFAVTNELVGRAAVFFGKAVLFPKLEVNVKSRS